jgi:hypothetical protein
MPRRKFAWASLPDEQLLEVRLKDLKLRLEGTWLENRRGKDIRQGLRETGERLPISFSPSRLAIWTCFGAPNVDGMVPSKR